METTTIGAKIGQYLERGLFEQMPDFLESLSQGDLHGFEASLSAFFRATYNLAAEAILKDSAVCLEPQLREKSRQMGLRKLVWRTTRLQIKTGHWVEVPSLYAKVAPRGYESTRHVLRLHWRVLKGASPGYYGDVCLLGVLCPSFEVACQVLDVQGIEGNKDRVRELSRALSRACFPRQAELSRRPGETLCGKRVLIGVDGGRTRMRRYTGRANKAGNATFDTPWMEPKMFVIDVLDEAGNVERKEQPIYGCLFGDDELVQLLASHLKGLAVEQAQSVQIVADGAPWIWNRVKAMLCALGVAEEKITETVDYYHASEYVHKIAAGLPKKYQKEAAQTLKDFKQWLWDGNIEAIVKKCGELFKRTSGEIKRYIGYLSKNSQRMRYQFFRNQQLVCGSGIIESGIRRVVNLRFKNASAFWNPANVEGLYFLRGVLLAYRWKTLITNIVRI